MKELVYRCTLTVGEPQWEAYAQDAPRFGLHQHLPQLRTVGPLSFIHNDLALCSSLNLRPKDITLHVEEPASGSLDEQCPISSTASILKFLQRCSMEKDVVKGRRLHCYAVLQGLESDSLVGSHLTCMFLSCGSLPEASQIFWNLHEPTPFSCGAIISAYAKFGRYEQALEYYHQLKESTIKADGQMLGQMFVTILKACAAAGDFSKGRLAHSHVLDSGLEKNTFVANTLVDMYGRSGTICDARIVFQCLPKRDVVTWNALITGYSHSRNIWESLRVFHKMQHDGVHPDRVTFVCILKCCSDLGCLDSGKILHAYVVEHAVDLELSMGSTLIDMYGHCGSLDDACSVFDRSPKQDVTVWSTMITEYVQHRHSQKALLLFQRMQDEDIDPDQITFVCSLKASSQLASFEHGTKIHAHILEKGLEAVAPLGSVLVDMYSRCGCFNNAEIVFNRMSLSDVFSWSALIGGYVEHGYYQEALCCFWQMLLQAVVPDKVIFACILRACLREETLNSIHAQVIECGFEVDSIVGNTLIDMYNKHDNLECAWALFKRLPLQDVITWNVMIDGLIKQECPYEALSLFYKLQRLSLEPNLITYVCVTKACSDLSALEQGKVLHACFIESGLVMDVFLSAALIDMYSKCGCFEEALALFESWCEGNLVAWNALIAGLTLHEHCLQALQLFHHMQQHEGIAPDQVTFVSILKACSGLSDIESGRLIHVDVVKSGLEGETFVGNTIIDMYGSCGSVSDAVRMFERMKVKNQISWGALMGQYAQHDQGKEALLLFEKMQQMGMKPDQTAYVSALNACGCMAAAEQGKHLHLHSINCGLDLDLFVGTALVTMYGKCGSVEAAMMVFNRLPKRSIVGWNAMVALCADNSDYERALQHVHNMKNAGLKPNHVTYLSLLSACNHLGLVEKGCEHFKSMRESHLILPRPDHYNSMACILGHAGRLKEAQDLLETIPLPSNFVGWSSLLSSCCRTHGHLNVARQCFHYAIHINPEDSAVYLVMAKIYAQSGMQDGAQKVHALRRSQSLWKKPGKAYIEVGNQVHEFVVSDRMHPHMDEIDAKLKILRVLAREEVYGPFPNFVFSPTSIKVKEDSLCGVIAKRFGRMGAQPLSNKEPSDVRELPLWYRSNLSESSTYFKYHFKDVEMLL